MKKFVQVKTRFEATHHYPNPPHEVSFLKYPHRHEFHVTVKLEVYHDDRELEFILLKREVNDCIVELGTDLGTNSCEQMGMSLYSMLRNTYGVRKGTIEISEDGENSAILEFDE